jgi:hypothetical protein
VRENLYYVLPLRIPKKERKKEIERIAEYMTEQ